MKHWYVAIVRSGMDMVAVQKLQGRCEVFLIAQKYVSTWRDGRRKERLRLLLPGKVLIRCTEQERLRILEDYSFISRCLVDIAGTPNEFGRRPLAVVPDEQVERLRVIFGQSESKVDFIPPQVAPGMRVRIRGGALEGVEGTVLRTETGSPRVIISFDHLGCATVDVPLENIETAPGE